MSVPMSARRMTNPVPDDDLTFKEGMHHFADHCASCHSNDGSGGTEIGQSLYPKAPDMRQQPTQALSDGELYYIIQNGIRLSGMPAWGKLADEHDAETWALVRFIRHLPSLSGTQVRQMQQWNPVSREDQAEDQDEEDFLSGQDAPSETRKNMKKGK